jgi:hypothetical protein
VKRFQTFGIAASAVALAGWQPAARPRRLGPAARPIRTRVGRLADQWRPAARRRRPPAPLRHRADPAGGRERPHSRAPAARDGRTYSASSGARSCCVSGCRCAATARTASSRVTTTRPATQFRPAPWARSAACSRPARTPGGRPTRSTQSTARMSGSLSTRTATRSTAVTSTTDGAGARHSTESRTTPSRRTETMMSRPTSSTRPA